MDTWANLKWHYKVHQRLGEQLVFYLLQVRPFEGNEIERKLTHLLTKEELESIRIFKIVGPNDLIIRAWHHSNVTPKFPEWLKEALVYGIQIHPFIVRDPYIISSSFPNIEHPEHSDLLDSLFDEDTIRAVQNGHDNNLLQKLMDADVVFTHDQQGADPIRFYLAISLSQKSESIQVHAVKELYDKIEENMPTINISIYRGYGFCDILVKGEIVDNLFSIGEMIDWVYDILKKYGATTETYIVPWPGSLVETSDRISESTLKALQGKNLFVQNILPELYENWYSRKKPIEDLLSQANKPVVIRYKKLVREYLLGHLESKGSEMGKVLFICFTEIEEFLRDRHEEFIGRAGLAKNKNKVYDATGVDSKSNKNLSLGDLLNIYSYVIKKNALSEDENLFGNWNSLVELRNKSLHGAVNYKSEWRTLFNTLLEYLPQIEELINLVVRHTDNKKPYEFTYFQLFLNDQDE